MPLLLRGGVVFFGANKAPNFVTLNPGELEVSENFVLIRGARRAKFDEELLNCRAVNTDHPHGGAKRVALNQSGNNPNLAICAQFVHGANMLERSSIVNKKLSIA